MVRIDKNKAFRGWWNGKKWKETQLLRDRPICFCPSVGQVCFYFLFKHGFLELSCISAQCFFNFIFLTCAFPTHLIKGHTILNGTTDPKPVVPSRKIRMKNVGKCGKCQPKLQDSFPQLLKLTRDSRRVSGPDDVFFSFFTTLQMNKTIDTLRKEYSNENSYCTL